MKIINKTWESIDQEEMHNRTGCIRKPKTSKTNKNIK